jgi:arylsulfatase A-like enzyme
MRDRWGTLLSVDDLVAGVVRNLEQLAVLDKTYILFSSDHGCASLVSPLVSLGLS